METSKVSEIPRNQTAPCKITGRALTSDHLTSATHQRTPPYVLMKRNKNDNSRHVMYLNVNDVLDMRENIVNYLVSTCRLCATLARHL